MEGKPRKKGKEDVRSSVPKHENETVTPRSYRMRFDW